jgi:hypothetical protein
MKTIKIGVNDELKECNILYTFKSNNTKNYYLICTDNTYSNNELNLYSFIFFPKDKNRGLEVITNKEDMDEVKEFINLVGVTNECC